MFSSHRSRRRLASWHRSAETSHVRTFAVLVVVSGLVQIVRPADPATTNDAAISVATTTIIGLLYWVLAPRFRVWTFHLVMAGGIALGLGSILRSASAVDATIVSTSLLWTGVLVAAISPKWISRAYAVFLSVGSSLALLAAGVDAAWRLLIVLALTTVATMELVNRLSGGLRTLAASDPLTGLANRAGLLDIGERLVSEARRTDRSLALAVIDLDGFKSINDGRGHAAGDELLVECAAAWRRAIREGDVLARLGGDEFVLLAPGADRETAEHMLVRMQAMSPTPWTHGLSMVDRTDDLSSLLERADLRLLQAKADRAADVDPVRSDARGT